MLILLKSHLNLIDVFEPYLNLFESYLYLICDVFTTTN